VAPFGPLKENWKGLRCEENVMEVGKWAVNGGDGYHLPLGGKVVLHLTRGSSPPFRDKEKGSRRECVSR